MARLVAEILDDIGNCQTIAHTVFEQCKSMEEIIESISAFGREVAAYLAGFAPAS
jgi:hypothetical protein